MRLVIVLDCNDADRLVAFWTASIRYRVFGYSDPYVVLVPESAEGPELLLQRVGEPKTTKNRMHLDTGTGELDATVEKLVALGTQRLQADVTEEAGFRWVAPRPRRRQLATESAPRGRSLCRRRRGIRSMDRT
jgi:hypothetical protein